MKLKNRLIPFVTLLITILLYQSVFAAACCDNPQIKTTTHEHWTCRYLSQVLIGDNITKCIKCKSGNFDMYENRWYSSYDIFVVTYCLNCYNVKESYYTVDRYEYTEGYFLKCDRCGHYY